MAVFPNVTFLCVLEFNYEGFPWVEHYPFSLCSFISYLLAWPPPDTSPPVHTEGCCEGKKSYSMMRWGFVSPCDHRWDSPISVLPVFLQPTRVLDSWVFLQGGPFWKNVFAATVWLLPHPSNTATLSLLFVELVLLYSWPMWPFIFSDMCPLKYIICILPNFAKSDRKCVA